MPEVKEVDLSAGRRDFLAEAEKIAGSVTKQEKRRHNIWMDPFSIFFVKKGEKQMLNAISTLLVVASLLLGGGGATVAYAQGSLPDQALYGVKLLSEDIYQEITSDPQAEWQLSLELTNRRIEEIQALIEAGEVLPDSLVTRYQNQVEAAIRFASNLPDDQAIQALTRIRESLQAQQNTLAESGQLANGDTTKTCSQLQDMLQTRLSQVEDGLVSPDRLRDQLQQHDQIQLRDRDPLYDITATADDTLQTPVLQDGENNPWTDETPVPGSGYGPGPGPDYCDTCTPVYDGTGQQWGGSDEAPAQGGSQNSSQGGGSDNSGGNGKGNK